MASIVEQKWKEASFVVDKFLLNKSDVERLKMIFMLGFAATIDKPLLTKEQRDLCVADIEAQFEIIKGELI